MDLQIFNIESNKTYILVFEEKEYKKKIEERGVNYIITSENEICIAINKIGDGKVLI